MNMKDMKIPILKSGEITIIENNESLSIFYGVEDIRDKNKALDLIKKECDKYDINKFISPYDFKNNTQIENKKWSVVDKINVYENTMCENINTGYFTTTTNLLKDSKSDYEIIYWAILKLNITNKS